MILSHPPGRVVLAPSNSLCIVEFLSNSEAKSAFQRLAYTKYHHVPLFIEWAPKGIFSTPPSSLSSSASSSISTPSAPTLLAQPSPEKHSSEKKNEPAPPQVPTDGDEHALEEEEVEGNEKGKTTLFVKNLNFATTEEQLKEFFGGKAKVRSVRIAKKKKKDKDSGKYVTLSCGYAFVEFVSQEIALQMLKKKQGKILDEHELTLKFSKQIREGGEKKGEKRREEEGENPPSTKLMVKNIAFEANKKEIRELFSPFGNVKSIRLPKKFNGSHRGFGYIAF